VATQALHSNRVKVNVRIDSQTVAGLIVQDRFESSLKRRPSPFVLSIESNAITDIEPLGSTAQVGLWRSNLEMIMVGHQNINV
jgi:hypothetical protein